MATLECRAIRRGALVVVPYRHITDHRTRPDLADQRVVASAHSRWLKNPNNVRADYGFAYFIQS